MKMMIIVSALAICSAFSVEAARTKCKFAGEPCTDMAEEGANFCTRHKCASYGCNQMVAVLQRPKWATPAQRMMFGGGNSRNQERDKQKRYVAKYCKKHICNRQLARSQADNINWGFTNELSDEQGVDVFFCNHERLVGGKFCIKHACKVNTCGAQRQEVWKKGIGGDRTFIDSEKADWHVSVTETCRSHSSRDPASIDERAGKFAETEGDRKQAREKPSAQGDEKKSE